MKPVENADFDDGSTGSGESKRSLVGRNGSEVIIMIMMIFLLVACTVNIVVIYYRF